MEGFCTFAKEREIMKGFVKYFLVPLLLVLSACSKDKLSLSLLEGDWDYQYYQSHVVIDGGEVTKDQEVNYEEKGHGMAVRILKSETGYTLIYLPERENPAEQVFYPFVIEGNHLVFQDGKRVFFSTNECQIVSLSKERMELKADIYRNDYLFPSFTGNYEVHYYEEHATLTLVRRAG